jgi:hypothetical protein
MSGGGWPRPAGVAGRILPITCPDCLSVIAQRPNGNPVASLSAIQAPSMARMSLRTTMAGSAGLNQ